LGESAWQYLVHFVSDIVHDAIHIDLACARLEHSDSNL
jgi:hypothetical protein